MALTWTDVTTLIPSMSTVDVLAQAVILAFVDDFMSTDSDAWGEVDTPLYNMGAVLLCAHFAATLPIADNASGASGGAVTGQSLGDASISFAAPTFTVSDGAFDSTIYGRQYLALARTLPVACGAVLD